MESRRAWGTEPPPNGKTVTLHYKEGKTWPDDIEVRDVTPVDL